MDVTNYILLYFQPMHATWIPLKEAEIRVREARAGEKNWWHLDGEERDLGNGLMITVADKPVALTVGCHGR